MKKSLIIITIVALLAALTSGCALEAGQSPDSPAQEQETASLINESTTSTQIAVTPAENEANFRILVSDEVNAIEEFQSLNVTISHIGVHQSG
jgi:PBP1b-binding outer membrane lipoprotein LpoB